MMSHFLRDDDLSPSEQEEMPALAVGLRGEKAILTWLLRWGQ